MAILHMETGLVRSTGQQLKQTTNALTDQVQLLYQFANSLASSWQGASRDEFLDEMNLLLRNFNSLAEEGNNLCLRLQTEVDEWKAVDRRFGDQVAGAPVTIVPTTPAVSEVGQASTLIVQDFDGLMNYEPQYSDQFGDTLEELYEYLRDSLNGEVGETDLIQKMAAETGLTVDEARQQFDEILRLIQERTPDGESPRLNTLNFLHDDHWGSRRQILCGKVVGDNLGVHPAFAILVNPEGGLIGPGDSGITSILDPNLKGLFDENAWDYHGAAHDAYGYLINNHQIGPGYEYIDSPLNYLDGLDTNNPLSGQISGYLFWARKVGIPETLIETYIKSQIGGGLGTIRIII